MNKKILPVYFLLLAGIVVMNSCGSAKSVTRKITIESGQIPPGMRKDTFTLIGILHGSKNYDKDMRKEFNSYSGKYVLATYPEMHTNYADSLKYRYILDCFEEPVATFNEKELVRVHYTMTYRYFIEDRKTGVIYKRKTKSGAFWREIQMYLEAIEAVWNK